MCTILGDESTERLKETITQLFGGSGVASNGARKNIQSLPPPKEVPTRKNRPTEPPQARVQSAGSFERVRESSYDQRSAKDHLVPLPEGPSRHSSIPAPTNYSTPAPYTMPPSAAYANNYVQPPSAAYGGSSYNHNYQAPADTPLPSAPGQPYRRDYSQNNDYHPSGMTYGQTGRSF